MFESFERFLPSRRIVAFVVIPLTAFMLWLGITAWQQRAELRAPEKQSVQEVLAQKQQEYNLKDTDGDGLKDWEEFIAGTDFENRDTDGDGMSDYAESIRATRDPLDPNDPEPIVASSTDTATVTPFYLDDPSLTETEVFARDIFATFVQLQQADAFDTNVQDTLIESVGKDVLVRDKRKKAYSREALRILTDPTRNQIKQFGIRYYESATVLDRVTKNPLVVFADLSETSNPIYAEELAEYVQAYSRYQETLAELAVPIEIVPVYLELLNNIEYYIETLRVMANALEDPFGGLLAGRRLIEDERLLGISFEAIDLYLD